MSDIDIHSHRVGKTSFFPWVSTPDSFCPFGSFSQFLYLSLCLLLMATGLIRQSLGGTGMGNEHSCKSTSWAEIQAEGPADRQRAREGINPTQASSTGGARARNNPIVDVS